MSILEQLGLSGVPNREHVHREIEEQFLQVSDRLPDHWLPRYQLHWDHPISVPSLLSCRPSSPPTRIALVRNGLDGVVSGYAEVSSPSPPKASVSTSFDRALVPQGVSVRGKSGNVPFWPGGLDDLSAGTDPRKVEGIRTIPPGFQRGLRLPGAAVDTIDPYSEMDRIATEKTPESQGDGHLESLPDGSAEIDHLLPTTRSNLRSATKPRRRPDAVVKRDWAHVIDVNTPLHNFHELVPNMARQYPFELDTFQKHAVYHLELGDSVFVAAHTSAGKTVVAEYAIALAEKHMTRAIYTSPIKALSNQKFRDFKQSFSSTSVGILTGDVQINPDASCLIMTTEILRSMLYKGADLIRDVEFVIFDEVHYVNDAERGVVWEEVIIMLPDHINIILLSATVPNTKEFADWVGRTKKKQIYVISTAQRPVPLEHYLYAGRDMHRIVDSTGHFLGQGYKDAGEALRRKQDKEREATGLPPAQRARGTGSQRTRGRVAPQRGGAPRHIQPDRNLYVHLLGHLKKKTLLPVVVFTLSKRRCEENAATLTNADLCTAVEKSEIHVAIEKALSRLRAADRTLPQLSRMRDLLTRGIGVHHGGLLPIVKELVEILFARGLVKILFATETFAMGVNMPAKSVVFSGMRKHDGRSFRDILPGEYIQMAGRAGRRGLDPTGTVIIAVGDSLPEQAALHTMILGKPGKLSSQFRLTYNMILNLLRVEALRVEEMIKRSFSENASQRLLPDQQRKVTEGEKTLSLLPKLECGVCVPDIETFYDDSLTLTTQNQRLLDLAVDHAQGARFMAPGRVVILRDEQFPRSTVAVVLKQAPPRISETGVLEKGRIFFILALVDVEEKGKTSHLSSLDIPPLWPPQVTSLRVNQPCYLLTTVPLTSISLVSERSVKVDVDGILDRHLISRMNDTLDALSTLVSEWTKISAIPEIDWARIKTLEFQELLRSRNSISSRLSEWSCTFCTDFKHHYQLIHAEKVLKRNIANLRLAISDQNLELIPDYEQRVEVLRELKFINDNSTVLLKGRVACEINSADELVLTELILENTLAAYDPEEVVALLSSFVFQEKTEVEPAISPKLAEGRDAILAISERVGSVQDQLKVFNSNIRSKLNFGLMEVVYEWAKGMPFEQITSLTDVAEGTIVRVITRLDETCREVRDASRVIGDAELFKKMEECQTRIKRDIVFAASLYF